MPILHVTNELLSSGHICVEQVSRMDWGGLDTFFWKRLEHPT